MSGFFGLGQGGTCICLICGYEKPHTRAKPCIFEICPNCKLPMTRKIEF